MPFTIFTSMFLHGGWMHLIGNMWFLWIFGNNVEDFLGHFRFLIFYITAGVAAALVHIIFHFSSVIPMVGASGAIAGVMGAYLILFPTARIQTLAILIIIITTIPVPAAVWLGIWFFMQIISVGSSNVAWYAHIGGFVVGVYFIAKLMKKKGIQRRRAVAKFKRSRRPPTDWLH